MSRPKLLDLFCCAGGAAKGYEDAGFDVYCVDIDPQPNNPFWFNQGNAIEVLTTLLEGGGVVFMHRLPDAFGATDRVELDFLRLSDFTAIHASPPCQGYTNLNNHDKTKWLRLIEPVRFLLEMAGLPFVIENVQGAPVRRDLTLCGEMFGLGVIRHRYFELGGWSMEAPAHVPHRGRVAGWRHGVYYDGPYVAPYGNGGGKGTVKQWQDAMGIDWTNVRRELAEAIPPAYAEFIGAQLIKQLGVAA